jgi:hypothetical protein
MATRSREIVVDRLFDGQTQLTVAWLPRVSAAAVTRDLDAAKRERTLIRIDAGAGSICAIHGLLLRGSCVVSTDDSTARGRRLAKPVRDWIVDPRDGDRASGLVPGPASDSHAGQSRGSSTRVAVRCRRANGPWGVGVVVSRLPVADAYALAGLEPRAASDPALGLVADV